MLSNNTKINLKKRLFIKNFSYTINSNLISLIVSTLVILVIPKIIGIKEYGYWQLYLLYSSYVALMHFGWTDGIYLKIGGSKYEELDKNSLFSQLNMLSIVQFILAGVIILVSMSINQKDKKIIFIMLAITMVITNIRSLLIVILQATNRIKEYSKVIIIDRLLYLCIIILLLLFRISRFEVLIIADIIGKLISLLYSISCCKDIVFRHIKNFKFMLKESIDNINIGIKLTIAYIASLLIVGIVRFAIEFIWSVEVFGKVSLILSISNLMMVFVNSIGIVLFPMLKKLNNYKLKSMYTILRNIIMPSMLALLILYYPIKALVRYWLPNYLDSLMYMVTLFPIFVFESKIAILTNTYLKCLRKESIIMKINIISVVVSIVMTFITTFILKDINLAIITITFILGFKSTIAEFELSKIIKMHIKKDIIIEILLIIIFITSGLLFDSYISIVIYITSYILYLNTKKSNIKESISKLSVIKYQSNE